MNLGSLAATVNYSIWADFHSNKVDIYTSVTFSNNGPSSVSNQLSLKTLSAEFKSEEPLI